MQFETAPKKASWYTDLNIYEFSTDPCKLISFNVSCSDNSADPTNMLSWKPTNWGKLDYSAMKLPGDGQHLGSLRTYFAIAVIMFYDTEIRNNHKELWEKLKTAWENSFDTVIDDKSLASIPFNGEH